MSRRITATAPPALVDLLPDDRRLEAGIVVAARHVALTHSHPTGRFYQHGWHSWSPARWVRLDAEPHRVDIEERRLQGWDPGLDRRDAHTSHWVGAVEDDDGQVVLLGALGLDAHVGASPTHLWGEAERSVEWFVTRGVPDDVFAAYTELIAERWGRRRDDPGTVWCTWYSYGHDIDEDRIRDVLGQLRGWPVDVMLVDDGWEQHVGDWSPNERFGNGMADLSERIRSAGHRPGLWMAPLIAHESSELAQRHPQWLVHDAAGLPIVAGRNWGGVYHALDTTHPQARDHLAALIRRVAHKWGWTYLKLDFLYAAALPGWRHSDVPREEAYRSGIELMREAAGEVVHLNACGAPIIPSIGVFDSLRIGPDVHPVWQNDYNMSFIGDYAAPGTRHAVSTCVARMWVRDLVTADADVAYFRTRYNLLGPGQRRLLADLCRVAGLRATSDPPDWLNADEAEEMRAFLSMTPTIRRLGWHEFEVDGRVVDFGPAGLDHPPRPTLRAGAGGT